MGLSPTPSWIAFLLVAMVGLSRADAAGAPADSNTPPRAPVAEPATKKTIRLLTIGNSFARNATSYLRPLADAAGHRLILGAANLSGFSLERHWSAVEAAEAGKPEGGLYRVGDKGQPLATLRQMLVADRWDVITIQQASALSPDYATYQPYADNLIRYIRQHAPEAQIMIHQTWAYREDHPRFSNGQTTPEQMHQDIVGAYDELSTATKLPLIPVGSAFQAARKLPPFAYKPTPGFDPGGLVYPNLPPPSPSLHAGWSWAVSKTGKRTLRLDAYHASPLGRYLGACVFYEVLFDESVLDIDYRPDALNEDEAKVLRRVAHETLRATRHQRR